VDCDANPTPRSARGREEYLHRPRGIARLRGTLMIRPITHWLVCSVLLTLAGGCAIFGLAARAIPQIEHAKYKGLQGQTVGVMVWADRAVRIDYPTLRVDIGNGVQSKLAAASKAKDLEGTTYPVRPDSIVRYQKDHPESEALPVAEIAPRLGVSRLIYVEVEEFQTRSEASMELFRGAITATVRVIEVYPDGTAKQAFEQNNVQAVYPPTAPPEGVPNANDYKIYLGTLEAFTTEVRNLFIAHEVEP
jgi:hypothetical protein